MYNIQTYIRHYNADDQLTLNFLNLASDRRANINDGNNQQVGSANNIYDRRLKFTSKKTQTAKILTTFGNYCSRALYGDRINTNSTHEARKQFADSGSQESTRHAQSTGLATIWIFNCLDVCSDDELIKNNTIPSNN